jgi:hypothetical protein
VNKKKQKNFVNFGQWRFNDLAKRTKSFLVLFFKKERLAFFSTAPGSARLPAPSTPPAPALRR